MSFVSELLVSQFSNQEIIEIIIKYNGDIEAIADQFNSVTVEILNSEYAIVTLPIINIVNLYDYPEVEYFEIPKSVIYVLYNAIVSTCIANIQNPNNFGLTGEGVLVALIDSGLDITHPDFIDENGDSRILFLWDQTIEGNPPQGFIRGTEYTQAQLNEIIRNPDAYQPFPGEDNIGHGTAVAGIMAGNGTSSNGRQTGAAPGASVIAIKLLTSSVNYSTTTTQIMRAIKYATDKAAQLGMPLVINLSYGTNDGSHDGNSLFEQYIDDMSGLGKTSIVVATGNEGADGHHYSTEIRPGQSLSISFTVTDVYTNMYVSIWKDFADDMTFELVSPSGRSTGPITPFESYSTYSLDGTRIYAFYIQPNHYNINHEIFFRFIFQDRQSAVGLWHIIINGGSNIVNGTINMWLPSNINIYDGTQFLVPDINNTLTIPSTSSKVVSVGGYNSILNSFADFSGRGPLDYNGKPDICAPAVNILTTRPGGGYDTYTGTSMASPFVSGAIALMMQWGIVQNNDPFLYGQRVKAFLRKGASRSAGIIYPNNQWGYGVLDLCSTMTNLVEYTRNGGAFR